MRIRYWSSDVCSSDLLPIDVSSEHLNASALRLRSDYPALSVLPLVGDYTRSLQYPELEPPRAGRRFGFFPGSTLGNLDPAQALDFLRRASRLLRGGALLLGIDQIGRAAGRERGGEYGKLSGV